MGEEDKLPMKLELDPFVFFNNIVEFLKFQADNTGSNSQTRAVRKQKRKKLTQSRSSTPKEEDEEAKDAAAELKISNGGSEPDVGPAKNTQRASKKPRKDVEVEQFVMSRKSEFKFTFKKIHRLESNKDKKVTEPKEGNDHDQKQTIKDDVMEDDSKAPIVSEAAAHSHASVPFPPQFDLNLPPLEEN